MMYTVEPVDPQQALEWIRASTHGGDEWVGFDVVGWDASTWILHAMYETDELPSSLTYDDERQIEQAAGVVEKPPELENLLEGAVATGGGLCPSSAPGDGWRRLRWLELRERFGSDPFFRPPSYQSFPITSWPVNIRPPSEGSLDREQLVRLCDHLEPVADAEAICDVFVGRLPSGRVNDHREELLVCRGAISEIMVLYDQGEVGPTNIWPSDRSWFVYSDWDLWGTKVSGSSELIRRLRDDPELEAFGLVADRGEQDNTQAS